MWDTENADGEDPSVVIKARDRVLWREPLFWECWPRFNQVKVILKQKYGRRCRGGWIDRDPRQDTLSAAVSTRVGVLGWCRTDAE